MIHLLERAGAITRINTSRVGDVVVAALVCSSEASAAVVAAALDQRLAGHDFDLSSVLALEATDPFQRSVKVRFNVDDWASGAVSIEARVVRRVSETKILVRHGDTEVEKHERDLELVGEPH